MRSMFASDSTGGPLPPPPAVSTRLFRSAYRMYGDDTNSLRHSPFGSA